MVSTMPVNIVWLDIVMKRTSMVMMCTAERLPMSVGYFVELISIPMAAIGETLIYLGNFYHVCLSLMQTAFQGLSWQHDTNRLCCQWAEWPGDSSRGCGHQ